MSFTRHYDVQMTDKSGVPLMVVKISAEAFTIEDEALTFWSGGRVKAVYRIWDWVAENDED